MIKRIASTSTLSVIARFLIESEIDLQKTFPVISWLDERPRPVERQLLVKPSWAKFWRVFATQSSTRNDWTFPLFCGRTLSQENFPVNLNTGEQIFPVLSRSFRTITWKKISDGCVLRQRLTWEIIFGTFFKTGNRGTMGERHFCLIRKLAWGKFSDNYYWEKWWKK